MLCRLPMFYKPYMFCNHYMLHRCHMSYRCYMSSRIYELCRPYTSHRLSLTCTLKRGTCLCTQTSRPWHHPPHRGCSTSTHTVLSTPPLLTSAFSCPEGPGWGPGKPEVLSLRPSSWSHCPSSPWLVVVLNVQAVDEFPRMLL